MDDQTKHTLDYEHDIRLFAGGDEKGANAAFERLCVRCRPAINRHLWKWGVSNRATREDLVQDTVIKLWKQRSRFQFRGFASWCAFVQSIAHSCYVDWMRDQGQNIPPIRELAYEELGYLEPFLEATAAKILLAAHVIWLEIDASFTLEKLQRQLLAAQLYYIDGLSCEEIIRLLPRGSLHEASLSLKTLENWLVDPGVLRYLAYHTLYYSNDRLAAHLLGL